MKKLIISLTFALALASSIFSQTFTERTDITITPLLDGSVAWSDFDNDGDLDFLITGSNSGIFSKIYENIGTGFIERTDIVLAGVYNSSVAWGDFDKDDDLDILLTGWGDAGEYIAKIYENIGTGFTERTDIILPGIISGSATWVDYNNDGNLDIFLSGGTTGAIRIAKMYKNTGSNFEEQTGIILPALSGSTAAWGDFDNDDDLDLFITGYNGSAYISSIYENIGDNFTERTDIILEGGQDSDAAWGDYNNDGFLDLMIMAIDAYASKGITKVYTNNNGTGFTEDLNISLPQIGDGSADWGDFDNDGDLDILITGSYATTNSVIYENLGTGFTERADIPFTAIYQSSAEWGDFDNDGDLDIILTGTTGSVAISKIYQNNAGSANTVAQTPVTLSSNVTDSEVELAWNKSTDAQTPGIGLSYSIFVRSATDTIVMPHSNLISGLSKLPAMGNAQLDTTFILKNLSVGTYFWKVQTIDNNFAGSAWSTEQSFEIQGLIASYPFNGNPIDESGNGNSGSENGGIVTTEDRFGNANSAYSFDGVDDYLITPASNFLDSYNVGSISLWVKFNETTSDQTLFVYSTDEDVDSWYQISLINSKIYVSWKHGTLGYTPSLTGSTNLNPDTWYHIVVQSDDSNMNKVFINNKEEILTFDNSLSTSTGTDWFSDIQAIGAFNHYANIGAFRRSGTPYDKVVNGTIDDINIYNKVLSDSEILQLYANYNPPTDFKAISESDQIKLTWDFEDAANYEKFIIYRDGVDAWHIIANNNSDSVFVDPDVTVGQTAEYFITSVDIYGNESIHSDTIKVTNLTVTDYDGNIYQTIQIGEQVWMKENMKTTHYSDGTALIDGTGIEYASDIYTKYWYTYNDNLANKDTFGLLYTWPAAMNGAAPSDFNPSEVQGICPTDWHLPSEAEWNTLIITITNDGNSEVGKALKSSSGWLDNLNGNDLYGFNALPAGMHSTIFQDLKSYAYWYSSTQDINNSNNALFWYLINSSDNINSSVAQKSVGFSIRCVKDPVLLSESLIASYPFNGNANDETGNEYNGTVNGATSTTDRFGNYFSAYSFDGASNITIPHSTGLNPVNYTLSLWFKWDDFNTNNTEFLIAKGLENYEIHTGVDANINSLRYIVAGGSNFIDAPGAIIDDWQQVIATWDGTSAILYLNGLELARTDNPILDNDLSLDTSPFIIGSRSTSDMFFNGSIDDVKIYNRGLTSQEVSDLYNSEKPVVSEYVSTEDLVAYYPFNGDANDKSGNGFNGTVNGATLTTDKDGNTDAAYSFNGIDNHIEIQDAAPLKVDTSYSVSFWAKFDDLAKQGRIINKWEPANSYQFNVLQAGSAINFEVAVGVNVSAAIPAQDVWTHITCTYDKGLAKIYFDGTESASQQFTHTTYSQEDGILRFGAGEGASANFFDGSLDEVKLYKRTLTAAEVTSLYNNGVSSTTSTIFSRQTQNLAVNDLDATQNASWTDINNDNLPDLYLGRDNNTNLLLKNNGNGGFTSITVNELTTNTSRHTTIWADLDNNGFNDAISESGQVFYNNGDETFNTLAHFDGAGPFSAADIDNDGDLDISVAAFNNLLYINNNDGSFTQVLSGNIVSTANSSFNLYWADFNNDNFQDVFVANCGVNSEFYLNNGDGTFTNHTTSGLTTTTFCDETVCIGDVDNDGDLDIYLGGDGYLYMNDGAANFTLNANFASTGGTSSSIADIDNDGFLDIFAGNLEIMKNNGDGTFTKLYEAETGLNNSGYDPRGAAFADFNRNGTIDLMIGTLGSTNNLFYLNNGNDNNWSQVKLTGTVSNKSAIGARIKLTSTIGGTEITQMREISTNTGGLAQNELIQHFGLGDATTITNIEVRWPSGMVSNYPNQSINQLHSITEPSSTLENGLIAYYPFNGNANDESGNGKDATVFNNITYSNDRYEQTSNALLSDGISSYFSIPVSNADLGQTYTFSFWSNINFKTNYSFFVMYNNDTDNGPKIQLINEGTPSFHIDNNADWEAFSVQANQYNEWEYITVTYDNTNWSYYVNGGLKSSFTKDASLVNFNNIFWSTHEPYNSDYTIDGKLDDIRIYNRSLDQNEVLELYNTEKTVDINQGLIGYYPFNGNTLDESGNGNNGTNNGAILTADRNGNTDNAYNFNGSSLINLPSGILPYGNNPKFSTSQWIYVDDNTGGAFIGAGQSAADSYHFGLGINRFNAGVKELAVAHWGSTDWATGYVLPSGWHHIVYVSDGTNDKVYADGNLVASNAIAFTLEAGAETNIGSWNDQSGTNYYYNNNIDDVRIYNRAISDSEIQEIYNLEKPQGKLIAHYTFDGGTMDDQSGFNNNLTNYGASVTIGLDGDADGAYYFNGSSNSLYATNSNHPTGEVSVTYAAWVNIAQPDWVGNIISGGARLSNMRSSFILNAGKLAYVGEANDHTTAVVPALYQWIHVAVSKDGTDLTYYINGVQVETGILAGGQNITDTQINIGMVPGGGEYFQGAMDNIRIYDYPLSETEMLDLYNSEKPFDIYDGLIAHYEFSGDANDASGNENNGTLNGGISLTPDRHGITSSAYDFNGSDTYVSLPSVLPEGNKPLFSVSEWVNIEQNSYGAFFGSGAVNTNTMHFAMGVTNLSSQNEIWVAHHGADWNTGHILPLGWNMVTYVSDGTQDLIYVNGELVATQTIDFTLSPGAETAIGRWNDQNGAYYNFDGKIDDVRIYNKDLDADEVLSIYNAEKASVDPSLIFSEYAETDPGNNNYLEIYNPTGAAINLAEYKILGNYNGAYWTDENSYQFPTVSLAAGDIFILTRSDAEQFILDVADATVVNGPGNYVCNFDGNDVRAIAKIVGNDTTIIDVIGDINFYPGDDAGWDASGYGQLTRNHTLRRKFSVIKGNSDWLTAAGTNTLDSEWWYVNSGEPHQDINSHQAFSDANVTYFNVERGIESFNIDNVNHTITGFYPDFLDVSYWSFHFNIHFSSLAYLGAEYLSYNNGNTDLSVPFSFDVVAEDGTTQTWQVSATPKTYPSNEVIMKVNMSQAIRDGRFNAATDSVSINGHFNNWTTSNAMEAIGDSIYQISIGQQPLDLNFYYRFVINNNWNPGYYEESGQDYTPNSGVNVLNHWFNHEVPTYELNQPVADYRFSGNKNDWSENRNHGQYGNYYNTYDRYGSSNSAYEFRGDENNYMYLGNGLNLINNRTNYSISAWVKAQTDLTPGGTQQYTIISERQGGNNFQLAIKGNEIYYSYWSGGIEYTAQTGIINPWEWNLVTVSVNSSVISIYLNGELSNVFVNNGTIDFSQSELLIGTSTYADYFYGAIDDVKLYNRTLSQNDINDLYANYKAPTGLMGNAFAGYIELNWNSESVTDAQLIYIYRDGAAYDTLDVSASGDTLYSSYSDFNVTNGVTYQYNISSENSLQYESAWSNSVNILFGTAQPATISNIQYTTDPSGNSPYIGQTVTTSGIVTAVTDGQFFLQNGAGAWNGVLVFDGTVQVAVGDQIDLTAEVTEYNGLTELIKISTLNINSNGNTLPAPASITSGSVNNEMYEGVLVTVSNVICNVANNGFGDWIVNDGSGDIVIENRYFSAYSPRVNSRYNITGPVSYYYDTFRINPRDENDITVTLQTHNIDFHIRNIDLVPIQNVEINLEGSAVVYTDENGNAHFEGYPAGTYNYTITASGYEQKNTYVIINDQDVYTNFMLRETPVSNYALQFDGYDDFVYVNEMYATSFNLNNEYTVEAWINPINLEASGSEELLILMELPAGLMLNSNINGSVTLHYQGVSSNYFSTFSPANTIKANEWQHIAVSKDVNNLVKFYHNGVLIHQETTQEEPVIDYQNISFGGNGSTEWRNFDGYMDEVRIWNQIRTESEISSNLFNHLNGDESGLQVYYKFDESDGQYIFDETVNNYYGVLGNNEYANEQSPQRVETTWPYEIGSPYTMYMDFDGTELQYNSEWGGASATSVSNPNSSGINTSNNVGQYYTGLEIWDGVKYKLPGLVDFSSITIFKMKVYAPTAGDIILKLENIDNSQFTEVRQTISTVNQWVEVSFDFSTATNGYESNVYNRLDLFIDYDNATEGNLWYFDDIIGPAIIATPEDNFIAYYPFINGGSGDESGNGNHGNFYGGNSSFDANGIQNSAYYFNGIDSYMEIPYSDLNHPETITVSAWVNMAELQESTSLISTYYQGGYGFRIYNNSINWEVITTGSVGLTSSFSIDQNDVNNWIMITGVYNGSDIKIYKNGQFMDGGTFTSNSIEYNYANSLFIGSDASDVNTPEGLLFFNGRLDDIRIYNYGLSDSDILEIYNKEQHSEYSVTDYDGNVYKAVKIGDQVWMQENLRTTHYPNGASIPQITDNTQWANLGDNNTDDAFSYYNNDPIYDYGLLYSWAAAMNGSSGSNQNPSNIQGVCPDGWHLPSEAEWTQLFDLAGGTGDAGMKIKEVGLSHWNSPNPSSNETGFNALPFGMRDPGSGGFYSMTDFTFWWSATDDGGELAWNPGVEYGLSSITTNYDAKSWGLNVRCVQDDGANIPTVSIYDIQYTENVDGNSTYNGQNVTTSGIVTASNATKYFIQDGEGAWNGLYVYDSNNPTIGDHITITGTVSEYFELTELYDITSFTINSTNNTLPNPVEVSTSDANAEQYEGVLLRVNNATCINYDSANTEWTVNDGSGDLIINDLFYSFTPTVNSDYNIIGVLDYNYSNFKLNPRSNADITLSAGNTPPTINLTSPGDGVNIATESVSLEWTADDLDDDALTFDVYHGLSGSLTMVANNITELSYTVTGLVVGNTYEWYVVVKDGTSQINSATRTFSITGYGTLSGTISDGISGPIYYQDIKLYLYDSNLNLVQTSTVNQTGNNNYSINVSPGDYVIMFGAQGKSFRRWSDITITQGSTVTASDYLMNIGDFDGSAIIDNIDLSYFVGNWHNPNFDTELGPISGSLPNTWVIPDMVVDFEDLMVFTMAWNYNNKKVDLSFGNISAEFGDAAFKLIENDGKLELFLENGANIGTAMVNIELPDGINVEGIQTLIHESGLLMLDRRDANNSIYELNFANLNNIVLDEYVHIATIDLKTNAIDDNTSFEYAITDKTKQESKGFGELNSLETIVYMYPNPVRTGEPIQLYLENSDAEDIQITLTNLSGQSIKQINVAINQGEDIQIPTDNLKPGIYFVKIKAGESEYMKRIMIY